jgi:hypothetical protein
MWAQQLFFGETARAISIGAAGATSTAKASASDIAVRVNIIRLLASNEIIR